MTNQENRCPFCGGDVEAVQMKDGRRFGRCRKMGCISFGPCRITETEALEAFCRPAWLIAEINRQNVAEALKEAGR